MAHGTEEQGCDVDRSARGASARERALRFNRGVIGLCVVALIVLIFLPV
jgi:hypothetical protein